MNPKSPILRFERKFIVFTELDPVRLRMLLDDTALDDALRERFWKKEEEVKELAAKAGMCAAPSSWQAFCPSR